DGGEIRGDVVQERLVAGLSQPHALGEFDAEDALAAALQSEPDLAQERLVPRASEVRFQASREPPSEQPLRGGVHVAHLAGAVEEGYGRSEAMNERVI